MTRPALLLCALAALSSLHAASTDREWRDPRGKTFRGDPVEVIGPLALFRVNATTSRALPLSALSPEDCVRFHRAIADQRPRAARWRDAQGEAAYECVSRLREVDFAKLPEPELLLVLYAGSRLGESGAAQLDPIENLTPFIQRLQRVHPGRLAAIVFPTIDPQSHIRLGSGRTWLRPDPRRQSDLYLLSRFAQRDGYSVVLMTRHGVPLRGGPVNNVSEVMQFVDRARDLLWELNPANPRTARDRLHYLRAVRPLQFAQGRADPLLLIDPLRADVLRARGVTRIEAQLEVGADGAIGQLELLPGSRLPEPLVKPIAQALRINSVYLPAIEQGTPVAGSVRYTLELPAVSPQLASDAAWIDGDAREELPIPSWLVLKAIRVPENVFSTIERVDADGTVMLSAVTAGDPTKKSVKVQKNAFNSDWFAGTGGPGSVRPTAGETQEIDGEKLVWRKVSSEHGLVDFLGGAKHGSHDYCIGYAWTEIEAPADMEAWLGIGSDDGLKIWFNGELVNDHWVQRISRLDDEVIPLRLKKGPNTFLVKIQNMRGLWSFTARLRIRGQPAR